VGGKAAWGPMYFSKLSRQPAILATAVVVMIGVVWYVLGRPVQMPHSPLARGEKLACVSYAPFRGSQSPLDPSLIVPPEQIDADLAQLSEITSCIRTYATNQGLDRVPEFARKYGLSVLQGIWLGRTADRNNAEIETGIALAKEYSDVIRGLIVGNEVLLRGELVLAELRDIIHRVRLSSGVPVTYADVWEFWLKNKDLAPSVDYITIHILPYWEDFPIAANQAAHHVTEIYAKVAATFPGKDIMIGEVGWPSAGRMRDGAQPSPSNQAVVMHEVLAMAKRGNWAMNLIEAFDQPWKRQLEGTVGGHWGLLDSEKREPKFRWGGRVNDHPMWLYQSLLGIMLALVTFAAAYLAARSEGEERPKTINWLAVGSVALTGGLFSGWALAQAPLESILAGDWIRASILLFLAFGTPPIAAAVVARRTPIAGFATMLDSLFWRGAGPLERLFCGFQLLIVMTSITIALGLVFDPRYRDFPFAPLTGPILALFIASYACPPGMKRQGVAEPISAAILACSAIYIWFNESPLNWQAEWFAALLLVLSATCLRLRVAQS
jgi:exo-beta-1,3-glucanase (GH17 family)